MYNLKAVRQLEGLSQSELSRLSGIPIRAIQIYEAESVTSHRDINKAEALTVYKLAKALNCDMTDIMELD